MQVKGRPTENCFFREDLTFQAMATMAMMKTTIVICENESWCYNGEGIEKMIGFYPLLCNENVIFYFIGGTFM